jgi:FtsP/CotA-like multicopper oxidase with cupredoxin domain
MGKISTRTAVRAGRRLAVAATALGLGLGLGVAQAQDRVVSNPRLLGAEAPENAGQPKAVPNLVAAATTAKSADRPFDLNVVYTDGRLYNPATLSYDKVRLRSYNGTDVKPDAPYVAPTIQAWPGDTVRVNLDNQLPADPSCVTSGPVNSPHCFNGTNLHSHGLWVSPTGNSDNVLLSINPGVQFEYEYNIPRTHPAGTFWYHTHRHGSTALQVSSGMAGALIIRGERLPTPTANGDLDTLLFKGGRSMPDEVLLFQQIQYACLDAAGNIKVKTVMGPDGKPKVVAWVCDKGDTGVIETYEDKNGNGFGPGSWGQSGRYTSINGEVLATLKAKAGELARWRLIHAGVRDTLSVQFVPMTDAGVKAMESLAAVDGDAFRSANCVGAPVPVHVVASDGLTMTQAQRATTVTLQPGYRNDLLVVFPKAGNYCMLDAATPKSATVNGDDVGTRLLGKVVVAKGQDIANIPAFVTAELVEAAQAQMPAAVRGQVIGDLRDGLKLARFVPHQTVTDAEVAGKPRQEVTFNIDVKAKPTAFEVGSQDYAPRPYKPDRIDRTLVLGQAQEWVLKSDFVSHPFHIHVNPFEVVAILDPDGKDVSAPGAVDSYDGTVDPQYPGLKGVWKDTLWVKSVQKVKNGPYMSYTLITRTRYERYIGEYVLHCHILDHEDQGMMQNVEIVLPNGAGGVAHGHH